MISYEELSAALERYRARTRGEAAPPAHLSAPPPAAYSAPPPPFDDHTTGEAALPEDTAHHVALGGDDESTQVGGLPGTPGAPPQAPLSDEHSNELDIHDVLSDEEIH